MSCRAARPSTSRGAESSRLAATIVLAAVVVFVCAFGPAADAEPDPGRQLFERGLGVDGQPVTAVLVSPSGAATELPASLMPCSSCHGIDGQGRSEGGVSPSDVRWSALSRPASTLASAGRGRPAYDEGLLIRALALGFDASGEELHPAMPRYRLSHADAKALIDHLKALDGRQAGGVHDDRLVIGVLVSEPLRASEQAALAVLRAWAKDVSEAGLYGRRLELRQIRDVQATNPSHAGLGGEFVAVISLAHSPGDPLLETLLGNWPLVTAQQPLSSASMAAMEASPRWLRLRQAHQLPSLFEGHQMRAMVAAEILTAALVEVGRDLDRRRLSLALEHALRSRTTAALKR